MFCDNFKKYRKRVGMTQEEVARMMMVTPQAVSKWETGGGTPDISLLVPIAELFGISTDALFARMLSLELAALHRTLTISETLTMEEAEAMAAEESCQLLILDLDVRYEGLERMLLFTQENKSPSFCSGIRPRNP